MEVPTSHNEEVARLEDEPLEGRLARIVGDAFVVSGSEQLATYFAESADTGQLLAVQSGSTQEVQEVVRLANEIGLPVYTLNDRHLDPAEVGREGIVLDFCRMTAIEKLDKRNLLVHVQRGLTFEALNKELEKLDLKLAPPPWQPLRIPFSATS